MLLQGADFRSFWKAFHCVFICMYIHTRTYTCIFFIQSSADGHLGCFHVLAAVNTAAVNTGVHLSFSTSVFVSLRYRPRSRIAGSHGSSLKILDFGLGEDLGRKWSLKLLAWGLFRLLRTGNEPLDIGSHTGENPGDFMGEGSHHLISDEDIKSENERKIKNQRGRSQEINKDWNQGTYDKSGQCGMALSSDFETPVLAFSMWPRSNYLPSLGLIFHWQMRIMVVPSSGGYGCLIKRKNALCAMLETVAGT